MHNETGGSCHRSTHMQHDAIHKLLCSFPRVIADILRGYLGGNLVGRLDFRTLQQVSAERGHAGPQAAPQRRGVASALR